MKLSAYRAYCKVKIPSLKETGLLDTDLNQFINDAVREVNLIAKVYRGFTDFDLVANQQYYQVSVVAPTFQQKVAGGLWMDTGDGAGLKRVIPRTEDWLNNWNSNWRNLSAGTRCQYYWQEGDDLVLVPKIATNVLKGGRLFHVKIPNLMTNDDHFPFSGTTTELTAFLPLDKAVIEWVRWQVAPALDKETQEDRSYPMFVSLVNTARMQVRTRPDFENYYDTAMQVRT